MVTQETLQDRFFYIVMRSCFPAFLSVVPSCSRGTFSGARLSHVRCTAPSKNAVVAMSARRVRFDSRSGLHTLDIPGVTPWRPSPLMPLLLLGVAVAVGVVVRRVLLRRAIEGGAGDRGGTLNKDIAAFYDYRSAAWEEVWGEHLHHGLYFGPRGKNDRPLKGVEAQIETMRELLRIGGLDASMKPANILDVGCGIGGATRFLGQTFPEARVTGITLSTAQAARATELNVAAGLSDRVANVVLDALDMDFPDGSFDIVWSLESAEHIPDKHMLVSECMRVLRPGGTLVMLAWCLRESSPKLLLKEKAAIRGIQREYCLPRLAPPSEYQNLMRRLGLRGVKHEDWTERAAPFWWEVAFSAGASLEGWAQLKKYGWPLVRSALAMRHVIGAIKMGTFKLAAMTARKPTGEETEAEKKKLASIKGGCARLIPTKEKQLRN